MRGVSGHVARQHVASSEEEKRRAATDDSAHFIPNSILVNSLHFLRLVLYCARETLLKGIQTKGVLISSAPLAYSDQHVLDNNQLPGSMPSH